MLSIAAAICARLALTAIGSFSLSNASIDIATCEIIVLGPIHGRVAHFEGFEIGEGWCVRVTKEAIGTKFVNVKNLHFCDEPTS